MNTKDSDDDNEYNIRAPDPVIRETLVDTININGGTIYSNFYSYNNLNNNEMADDDDDDDDIFIADILQQSKEEYEKELLKREQREKERQSVIALCNGIKHKINRVKGHDIANKDIYETVLYIMDMFEMEEIINYSLKLETFDKTFRILGSLRLTHDEVDFLHKLIIAAL